MNTADNETIRQAVEDLLDLVMAEKRAGRTAARTIQVFIAQDNGVASIAAGCFCPGCLANLLEVAKRLQVDAGRQHQPEVLH